MNINLVLAGLNTIGYFLLSNITALFFLIGLGFIIYAVFLFNFTLGFIAIGLSLILISLILVKESQQQEED